MLILNIKYNETKEKVYSELKDEYHIGYDCLELEDNNEEAEIIKWVEVLKQGDEMIIHDEIPGQETTYELLCKRGYDLYNSEYIVLDHTSLTEFRGLTFEEAKDILIRIVKRDDSLFKEVKHTGPREGACKGYDGVCK